MESEMNINILFIFYWKCIMSMEGIQHECFISRNVFGVVSSHPFVLWRWGDKNWYLKSIHSSFIHFPHPSATHCTLTLSLSSAFCTKTFIRSSESSRSYRLPSLVIELNTTMHNGNASYELLNVCLFH